MILLLLIMKHNKSSEFSAVSAWDVCVELTESATWTGKVAGESFDNSRTVTWAQYPYRHLLTEHSAEEKRLLRRRRLVPKIFELSLLSTLREDTGLYEYTRYFILQDTQSTALLTSEIGDPYDPETAEVLKEATEFTFDNGLYVPSPTDMLRLDDILENAYQNGVADYNKR